RGQAPAVVEQGDLSVQRPHAVRRAGPPRQTPLWDVAATGTRRPLDLRGAQDDELVRLENDSSRRGVRGRQGREQQERGEYHGESGLHEASWQMKWTAPQGNIHPQNGTTAPDISDPVRGVGFEAVRPAVPTTGGQVEGGEQVISGPPGDHGPVQDRYVGRRCSVLDVDGPLRRSLFFPPGGSMRALFL